MGAACRLRHPASLLPGVVALGRRCGAAFALTGAGERVQRGEVTLAVIRALVVQGAPDLVHDGTGEHVQDLVSFIAGLEQSRRGVPNFWRGVVPQLRGDDLVHRQGGGWPSVRLNNRVFEAVVSRLEHRPACDL
jgi:hypothetical protein